MTDEVRARNLCTGDEIRCATGYLVVDRVHTRYARDFGIITRVISTTGAEVQYYPEDYLQVN